MSLIRTFVRIFFKEITKKFRKKVYRKGLKMKDNQLEKLKKRDK